MVEGRTKMLTLFLLIAPPNPGSRLPLRASAPKANLTQTFRQLKLGLQVLALFLQVRPTLLKSESPVKEFFFPSNFRNQCPRLDEFCPCSFSFSKLLPF